MLMVATDEQTEQQQLWLASFRFPVEPFSEWKARVAFTEVGRFAESGERDLGVKYPRAWTPAFKKSK